MSAGKNYIVGVFSDEDVLLDGVTQVREKGVKIEEVFTPYPVHGLEHVLGYTRSRLPMAAFLFGITGTTLALTTQILMLVVDWPMIIGGKPYLAFPDFVPVGFEFSILLASFGMVGTFMIKSDLKPYKVYPKVFDLRSTDDKHIMAVDLDENHLSEEQISDILRAAGADEVNKKVFND